MSINAATQSRRIATAIFAIAVTAALHGGWLADLGVPQRAPTVAITA
nr:hypothetical protein [uncultured Sphingosinicella sp.]